MSRAKQQVSDRTRRQFMTLEELAEELVERADHPLDRASVRTTLLQQHRLLDDVGSDEP